MSMKKITMLINRILSLSLAAALALSSPIVAYAEGDNEAVVVENSVNDNSGEASSSETGRAEDESASSSKEDASGSDDATPANSDEAANSNDSAEEKINNGSDEDSSLTSDEDAELDEEDEDELKDEDKDKECKHEDEFEYESNGDGTHIKKCKECGEVIDETEECEFDEDGVCIHCGYKKEEEEQEDQSFTVTVGDFVITAIVPAKAFDEDVEFMADEVTLTEAQEEMVDELVTSVEDGYYYVFDLRFVNEDGNEIDPKDGYPVQICIDGTECETDEVVHIKDDDTAEVIKTNDGDGDVAFEAESFSKYVVPQGNTKEFFKDTAYGTFTGDAAWNYVGTFEEAANANPGRYAIQISYVKPENKIYPTTTNGDKKCYIYGTQGAGTSRNPSDDFTFHIDAPANYKITQVDVIRTGKATFSYYPKSTHYDLKANDLVPVKNGGLNNIVLHYERITAKLTDEKQYANEAIFVNYVNGGTDREASSANSTFGSTFLFNGGKSGSMSNHCQYTSVYQDLAYRELVSAKEAYPILANYGLITNGDAKTTFRLMSNNGVPLFPDYDKYNDGKGWYWDASSYSWKNYSNYITNYYYNANVEFRKDTDGYWTIDSSQYKYVNNGQKGSNRKISPTNGEQFRPFNNNDNHFGMYLPIHFSVNETGTTNGKDTVFNFFGDDDVFVYVDGKLVLDLGGIHDKMYGQINFKTGDILIQGDYDNKLTSSVDDSCYSIDDNNNTVIGIGATNLYDIIAANNVYEFSQQEDHVLTVVYFERGANLSNCKISYNFTKTETRTVEYKGLKVDENHNPIAGAEFTLYTDEACTNVAQINNVDAKAVSDSEGTIKFTGLTAGIIQDGQSSVSRTYYMKETKAPDGYVTPTNAKWKLVLVAYSDGKGDSVLTAMNVDAQSLSLDNSFNYVSNENTSVKAIENRLVRVPKKLSVTKTVSNGEALDANTSYKFKIFYGRTVNNQLIYQPLADATYKINGSGQELKTDGEGVFVLKADQTAVFENLLEDNYQIAEVGVDSNVYSILDFETKIVVDYDYNNVITYNREVETDRTADIKYEKNGSTEKTVLVNNSLVNTYDWKVIKKNKNTQQVLAGAEFELILDGNADYFYGKTDSTGTIIWYGSGQNRIDEVNPVPIPDGKYTLKETKAPDGFALSTEEWIVTVKKYEGITITSSGQTVQATTNTANNVTTYSFNYYDVVAYTLPETGGRGVYVYTIGGVLLMIGAALLLYKSKKNNKNNK